MERGLHNEFFPESVQDESNSVTAEEISLISAEAREQEEQEEQNLFDPISPLQDQGEEEEQQEEQNQQEEQEHETQNQQGEGEQRESESSQEVRSIPIADATEQQTETERYQDYNDDENYDPYDPPDEDEAEGQSYCSTCLSQFCYLLPVICMLVVSLLIDWPGNCSQPIKTWALGQIILHFFYVSYQFMDFFCCPRYISVDLSSNRQRSSGSTRRSSRNGYHRHENATDNDQEGESNELGVQVTGEDEARQGGREETEGENHQNAEESRSRRRLYRNSSTGRALLLTFGFIVQFVWFIWFILGLAWIFDPSTKDECQDEFPTLFKICLIVIISELVIVILGLLFVCCSFCAFVFLYMYTDGNDSGDENRAATRDEVESLKKETYVEGLIDPDHLTCAICLSEYSQGEEIRHLPCKHHYHSQCVDQWLVINNTCPKCKSSIRKNPNENNNNNDATTNNNNTETNNLNEETGGTSSVESTESDRNVNNQNTTQELDLELGQNQQQQQQQQPTPETTTPPTASQQSSHSINILDIV